jgi:hypothetical protein
VLRLVQVGRARMEAERRRPHGAPRPDEDVADAKILLPTDVS